jgi:hypothetical protein
MKKFLALFLFVLFSFTFTALVPTRIKAKESAGFEDITAGCLAMSLTGYTGEGDAGDMSEKAPQNLIKYKCGTANENGDVSGLIPKTGEYIADLYLRQPSGKEYVADLLNNIGVPTSIVPSAYAQQTGGTGYKAMASFLPFWKVFRNLAYSLYIIMFIVVGIMIMMRTKINAQTIITIQTALPNLLITLLLITFSYAIVGFMIDIMYFLIYFVAFLFNTIGVLDGVKTVDRLMSHSAWGIMFSGRNTIISAIAETMRDVIGANSGAGIAARVVAGGATLGVSELMVQGIPYLLAAVWLAITMLKLIFVLLKSYVMLIIQTVTAPVQILMNAIPGSKAFTEWLKKTASYLIPFPVAAGMFIVSAVFIGDPTNTTWAGSLESATGIDIDSRDSNPFGVTSTISGDELWTPPFTVDLGWAPEDIMVLLGFFIFAMTPAAVKMAQDWLQVKESPYTAEAFGGIGMAYGGYEWLEKQKQKRENEKLLREQLKHYSEKAGT